MPELVWLHDAAETRAGAIADPAGLEIDERLQDSETIRFTIRADDPMAVYIRDDRLVKYLTRTYRITELTTTRQGNAVTIDVFAEALWIDLLGFPGLAAPLIDKKTSEGVTAILAGTNWTAGSIVEDISKKYSMNAAIDATVLGQLRAWVAMAQREITFDTVNRKVNVAAAQGSTQRAAAFRYGHNLTAVTRRSTPPVATRLYAYGGSNMNIANINPTGQLYVEDYSYYTGQGVPLATAKAKFLKIVRWTDERYIRTRNLLDAAKARIAKLAQPTVVYTAAVADLAAIMPAIPVGLGDQVLVDDAPTGIRVTTRVVRKVTRPLEPARTEIELGTALQPALDTATIAAAANLSSGGSGGATGSKYSQQTAVNTAAVIAQLGGSGARRLGEIPVHIAPGGAQAIFGLEVDGTADGPGTYKLEFFYDAANLFLYGKVGPTVVENFVAGPLHIAVADFLNGIDTDGLFYPYISVTTGTAIITIPAGNAHVYLLGTGIASDIPGKAPGDA
jgi:phage minor structural protein